MTTLYEKDFCGWSEQQSKLLLDKRWGEIDIENIIEEIESLGKSEKHKLESYLIVLLMHMLKATVQAKTRSWELSIKFSKKRVIKVLNENPSLKPRLKEFIDSAYESSILKAAQETGVDEELFPKECPWTIDEILDTKQG